MCVCVCELRGRRAFRARDPTLLCRALHAPPRSRQGLTVAPPPPLSFPTTSFSSLRADHWLNDTRSSLGCNREHATIEGTET